MHNWRPEYSRFGQNARPSGRHQGVDLAAAAGTAVNAVENGKIVFAGDRGNLGKTIILQFKRKDGKVRYAVYAHLSAINVGVEVGTAVSEGQMIGETGQTGNAEGQEKEEGHLHFEIRTQQDAGTGMEHREDPAEYFHIAEPGKKKEVKPDHTAEKKKE